MGPVLYENLPTYPPQLSQTQESRLLFDLNDFALSNGLAVRPNSSFVSKEQDPSGVLAVTAPVTLFPSRFPRSCYQQARDVATAYNELYARIASDENWLAKIMTELVMVDDFMENLWKVHLRVKQEGYVQDKALGLFRSDYMVHVDTSSGHAKPEIRQVEFNTISSSFGGLSSRVAKLHRYLAEVGDYPDGSMTPDEIAADLPASNAVEGLVSGLADADAAYATDFPRAAAPRRCCLFVVQDPERNIFDQRHLEYTLRANHNVLSFRIPFSEVSKNTRLLDDRRLLYVPPNRPDMSYEVSVIYLRATYTPTDFPDAAAWEARYQLERSAAIKCPSILTHLAGSKKIQQVLATPESPDLARFLPHEATAARVRRTFAAIYPLDNSPAGLKAKQLALDPATANGYVLKPQREGGGNNIYRDKIPAFLRGLGSDEDKWAGHILMEIIEPPEQSNVIARDGKLYRGDVIVELGIYGTALWKQTTSDNNTTTASGDAPAVQAQMLHNREAGYLLRTKASDSEEGGVAAGFGSVDSLLLVDV